MSFGNHQNLKPWQILLPLIVAVSLVFGLISGMYFQENQPRLVIEDDDSGTAMQHLGYGRMEELIRYIEAKYVDTVAGGELVEGAIDHLLSKLDPHSNYISKEDLQAVNEQLQGNFDGIGIEFIIVDDTLHVVETMQGGPAEHAGILTGDQIIQVEDSIIAGKKMDSDDVVEFLRGSPGSKVTLGVLRSGEKTFRQFTVKRDKIPTQSVDVHYMLDQKTGFIKLNRFSANSFHDFMAALEDLVDNHRMKDLVLDLRENPGGFLEEATQMLSQVFDKKDQLMVYTMGRNTRRVNYETTGNNRYDIEKVAILIDENSASASEIIAGAVQDWDRGVVIGRRSFGKGLVQEQYKLSDGSALRLTVARYYTPSGRCIQRPYADAEAYEEDLVHRFKTGELQSKDKIEQGDTTKFFTANGRVVYGGGGITPDYFVPMDTALFSEYYLFMRNAATQFAFKFYMRNRETFKSMAFGEYEKSFRISDDTFKEFLAFAERQKIRRNNRLLARTENTLRLYLKARLGKHLYEDSAFYKIMDNDDPFLKETKRALSKTNALVELKK